MRGRAADDLERASVTQLSKRRERIAVPIIDKEPAAGRTQFEVKLCQLGQLGLVEVTFSLAQREIDQKIYMPDVALAQKFVLQHRAQRWGERHREFERNLVVREPLHHSQQRDVSFGDRLEEPVFLEEVLVLRMPNERQVRVKNKREVVHIQSGNRKAETGKKKMSAATGILSVGPLSGGAHRVHELLCALRQFSPVAVANQHWIEHATVRAYRDCTVAVPFFDIGCLDAPRWHDRIW